MKEIAKQYREKLGWNVIPLAKKSPYIKWQVDYDLDRKLVTLDQIEEFWNEYPDANIGLLTGRLSKIVVFDCDDEKALDWMEDKTPKTVCAQSSKWYKLHFYFKYPEHSKKRIPNVTGMQRHKLALDVKADDGIVVLPPSIHKSGVKYTWINKPWEVEMAELDILHLEYIFKYWREPKNYSSHWNGDPNRNVPEWVRNYEIQGVEIGARDQTAFSLAKFWLRRGLPDFEVMRHLEKFNMACSQGLTRKELETKIRSAKNYVR